MSIKTLLLLLALTYSSLAFSNMASPVLRGSMGARPFVNMFVDVVHEDLDILLGADFEYAQFKVTYYIESDQAGTRIPLMFYASDYFDSFEVEFDGESIDLKQIPDEIRTPRGTKFREFSYLFDPKIREANTSVYQVAQELSDEIGFRVDMNDMLYFEADIPEGKHVITVSYRATPWMDRSDWINQYSFRYALSPAKYWRSFGTLKVSIDSKDFQKEWTTNVNRPTMDLAERVAVLTFDELPTDILEISYQPTLSVTQKALIGFGPMGMALCYAVIFLLVQYKWVVAYRLKYPDKSFSWSVILGGLLFPFLFCAGYMINYSLIDALIGKDASGFHGYTFLIFILYPLIVPVYGVVFWILDRRVAKR